MSTLKNIVSRNFTTFTDSDQQIYQTLLKESENMHDLTINELAKLSFTSKSSILRFVQKLGFSGFSDFKYSINWEEQIKPDPRHNSALINEIALLGNTLTNEKIKNFQQFIQRAAFIYLAATGEDQHIQMNNFGRFLLKKGITSSQVQLNPNSEVTKLVLDQLTEEHLLIIFSASGKSRLVKQYLTPLLEKNVTIIAITAFSHSWLADIADLTFSLNLSPKDKQLFPYSSGLGHLLLNLLAEAL